MRVLKKELWPYKIKIGQDESNVKITEIEQWLGETLGTFKSQWNVVYQFDSTDFYFRTRDDAVLFKLSHL
jgi:hypothetical protein